MAPFEGQHFVPIDMQLSTFIKKFSTFSKLLTLLSYSPAPPAFLPLFLFTLPPSSAAAAPFFCFLALGSQKKPRPRRNIWTPTSCSVFPPSQHLHCPQGWQLASNSQMFVFVAQQQPVLALTLVLELFLAAASSTCDDKSLLTDYSTVGTYCRHSLAPTSNNNERNNNKNNKNNRGSSHKQWGGGGGNKSTEKSNKSRSVSSK